MSFQKFDEKYTAFHDDIKAWLEDELRSEGIPLQIIDAALKEYPMKLGKLRREIGEVTIREFGPHMVGWCLAQMTEEDRLKYRVKRMTDRQLLEEIHKTLDTIHKLLQLKAHG